jgi:hypothetical protein
MRIADCCRFASNCRPSPLVVPAATSLGTTNRTVFHPTCSGSRVPLRTTHDLSKSYGVAVTAVPRGSSRSTRRGRQPDAEADERAGFQSRQGDAGDDRGLPSGDGDNERAAASRTVTASCRRAAPSGHPADVPPVPPADATVDVRASARSVRPATNTPADTTTASSIARKRIPETANGCRPRARVPIIGKSTPRADFNVGISRVPLELTFHDYAHFRQPLRRVLQPNRGPICKRYTRRGAGTVLRWRPRFLRSRESPPRRDAKRVTHRLWRLAAVQPVTRDRSRRPSGLLWRPRRQRALSL